MSGAGAGKGLLARCICIIAFGREPHAVTAGATAEELEKRIAAELIEGSPALFLDNLNYTAFRSNLLASAITERPARVRLLGRSQMVPLNSTAFVILTGNGLTVSEDLARRFIAVDFDPRAEDPEARPFKVDIRAEVTTRRKELLAAVLTIWRWGRITTVVEAGLPLGSFAQWCHWVRDPLRALGCHDPAERVSEAKERDGRRQAVADLFAIWWDRHRDRPIAVRQLHEDVKQAADPQGRGRQHLASQLEKLAGTRMAGFVLTRQAPVGRWGVATYALQKTGGAEDHRDHRGHRVTDAPYAPYADGGQRSNGHTTEASPGIEITFDRMRGGKRTRTITDRPDRPTAQDINDMDRDGRGGTGSTVPPTVPLNTLKNRVWDGADGKDANTQTGKGTEVICAQCGRPGGNEVAFGDEIGSVWLHRQCEAPWIERRMGEEGILRA
jgi:hypothetical protein